MSHTKRNWSGKKRQRGKSLLFFAALFFVLGAACIVMWGKESLEFQKAETLYRMSAPGAAVDAWETGPPQINKMSGEQAVDLSIMREVYPDFVGWIKCEETPVDYPVVQGDDNEFYLNHLADLSENSAGSIFLDSQAAPDFSSDVSVLYGHHVKSGLMFGSLEGYREQDYYEKHPVLQLFTPEKNYRIELIAAYLEDGAAGSYPLFFENEEEWDRYMQNAEEASFFKSAAEPEWGDRIVILSTCAYDFRDARLAVVGLLKDSGDYERLYKGDEKE